MHCKGLTIAALLIFIAIYPFAIGAEAQER